MTPLLQRDDSEGHNRKDPLTMAKKYNLKEAIEVLHKAADRRRIQLEDTMAKDKDGGILEEMDDDTKDTVERGAQEEESGLRN
jgi:Mg/Co/Ni transporter MgtE